MQSHSTPAGSGGTTTHGDPESGITIAWEEVWPDKAMRWLSRNKINRPMTDHVVSRYARHMKEGIWREDNPEPIIFDASGGLLNGQHRLEAVVRSESRIRFLVARGVDAAVRPVLDTGRSRSAGDVLGMEYGLSGSESKIMAAAIRALHAWATRPDFGPAQSASERNGTALSAQEVNARFPALEAELRCYYPVALSLSKGNIEGGAGFWLAILIRLGRIEPDKTMEFARKLATGSEMSEGNPILTLRNRILAMGRDRRAGQQAEIARITINAWNAWRRGERRLKLVDSDFRQGKALAFPKPI